MERVNFDNSELKGRIIAKYGSAKEFASAVGETCGTVSRKINGKREMKREDIIKYSRALEIEDGEISKYFFAQRVAK